MTLACYSWLYNKETAPKSQCNYLNVFISKPKPNYNPSFKSSFLNRCACDLLSIIARVLWMLSRNFVDAFTNHPTLATCWLWRLRWSAGPGHGGGGLPGALRAQSSVSGPSPHCSLDLEQRRLNIFDLGISNFIIPYFNIYFQYLI